MSKKENLIELITTAFADVQYPGDWCLKGSNEGTEPAATAMAFKGKTERYSIDAKLLDEAPNGLSSALCFFSDEAFRFYLPAYMIADLRGQLREVDIIYHLTNGLDNKSRKELINPNRYGERTWYDAARYKFSIFSDDQTAAIVAFLEFKKKKAWDFEKSAITQALRNYWYSRHTWKTD